MLEGEIIKSNGDIIKIPESLNEISISKNIFGVVRFDAIINGKLINSYTADGILVCTPTGSTAYNLSVGGPLMIPQTRSLIISPIATHALNVRPIVIPDDWKIDLVMKSRSHSYLLSIDGRSVAMKEDITLHIEKAPYTIKLVQIDGHTFLNSLKEKLAWGN